MAAPVFKYPASANTVGELRLETGVEEESPTISLREVESLILKGLSSSLTVRNSEDRLKRVPNKVPRDLDRFCCFLETSVENDFEGVVEKLGRELHRVKTRRSLGIVSMERGTPSDDMESDIFPVPETNNDPVIAQIRGWFACERFFTANSIHTRNLHSVDLSQGIPEDNDVEQSKIILRVAEAAARQLIAGASLAECPAARALGYRAC